MKQIDVSDTARLEVYRAGSGMHLDHGFASMPRRCGFASMLCRNVKRHHFLQACSNSAVSAIYVIVICTKRTNKTEKPEDCRTL